MEITITQQDIAIHSAKGVADFWHDWQEGSRTSWAIKAKAKLIETLSEMAENDGWTWGSRLDQEADHPYRWVVYYDTPHGQVSFHDIRIHGPAYRGEWSGEEGGNERILPRLFEDRWIGERTGTVELDGETFEWSQAPSDKLWIWHEDDPDNVEEYDLDHAFGWGYTGTSNQDKDLFSDEQEEEFSDFMEWATAPVWGPQVNAAIALDQFDGLIEEIDSLELSRPPLARVIATTDGEEEVLDIYDEDHDRPRCSCIDYEISGLVETNATLSRQIGYSEQGERTEGPYRVTLDGSLDEWEDCDTLVEALELIRDNEQEWLDSDTEGQNEYEIERVVTSYFRNNAIVDITGTVIEVEVASTGSIYLEADQGRVSLRDHAPSQNGLLNHGELNHAVYVDYGSKGSVTSGLRELARLLARQKVELEN